MPASLREILRNTRALNQYFLNEPSILKKEGIFRISSTPEKRQAVLNALEVKQALDIFDAHALVAAYKFPLQIDASELVNQVAQSPSFAEFKAQIISTDCNEQQTAKMFYDFVLTFVQSEELNDWHAAEMIHDYFHLAKKITEHQDDNKMGSLQMGVILGAFIAILFDMDGVTQMSRSQVLNNAAQQLIESDAFAKKFIDSYANLSLKIHQKHLKSFVETEQSMQGKYALMLQKYALLQKEVTRICKELEGTEKLLNAYQLQPKKKKQSMKDLERQLERLHQASEQGEKNLVAYQVILEDELRGIEEMGVTLSSLRESIDYIEKQDLEFQATSAQSNSTELFQSASRNVRYAQDPRTPKSKAAEPSDSDDGSAEKSNIRKKR